MFYPIVLIPTTRKHRTDFEIVRRENPGFQIVNGIPDRFQSLTLDYIRDQLTPLKPKFADSKTTKIYIMTPTGQETVLSGGTARDSEKGDYPQEYLSKYNQIVTLLGTVLPDVPVDKFVYARQNSETHRQFGSFGKAMVSTSINLHYSQLIVF